MNEAGRTTTYFGRDLEAMSVAVNYSSWILEEFRPFMGKKVGEIGGGNGNFSHLLLNAGVEELLVVEPSSNMYPLLQRRMARHANVTTVHSCLEDIYARFAGRLDTLFYINVLEHIEEDQRELMYARACLKDRGTLCLFVPALPWLYSSFDASLGHRRRYTMQELDCLLKESGFEVLTIKYFDFLGAFLWYFFFVQAGQILLSSHVSLYDSMVVRVMKRLERKIRIPLGKNLLAVGRVK